jgi:hypothetical protein
LDLVGLLPSAVTAIDELAKRSYAQYQQQPDAEDSNTPPPVRGDLFGDVSFWPYWFLVCLEHVAWMKGELSRPPQAGEALDRKKRKGHELCAN